MCLQMWPPPYGPGSYTRMSAVTKCDIWNVRPWNSNVSECTSNVRPPCGPGSYMGMSDVAFEMSDVTFEMSDVTFHNVRRWHFTTAQIWNVTFAKMSENVRKCQEMSGIFCYEMWHSVYNRYLNVTFCISPYPHRMRCNILLRNTVGVYVKTVPP